MIVTLEKAKTYLRVDSSDEDALVASLTDAAESLVADAWRLTAAEFADTGERGEQAALFALGYLYEHREEADHRDLTLSLRALGVGIRKAEF